MRWAGVAPREGILDRACDIASSVTVSYCHNDAEKQVSPALSALPHQIYTHAHGVQFFYNSVDVEWATWEALFQAVGQLGTVPGLLLGSGPFHVSF